MAQHRVYIGGHEEVDVPLLDRIVARGEAFEVTAEQADTLDASPELWAKPNTTAAKEA